MNGMEEREERQARVKAVRAALVRLDEFKGRADEELLGRLRLEFERRISELDSSQRITGNLLGMPKPITYQFLLVDALEAERRTILRLRNEGVINDEVLRRIQRDLDLVELQFNRS